MRIGIDATCWANARGYGRFAREIVPAMAALAPNDEFICFLDPTSAETFRIDAPNVRQVVVTTLSEAPSRAASARGHRTLRDMLRMSRAVAREKPDVFFWPTVYTYYPLPRRLRTVVTIHDTTPERFPRLVFPSRRARIFWRLKLRLALMQARQILTVSDFAARDLMKMLGVPASRLSVAPEAPAAAYRPRTESSALAERLPAGSRWFTYVGGFNPHKNVVRLVRAHAMLARELGALAPYLFLVGTTDRDDFYSDVEAILAAIASEGTEKLIIWTGFIDDVELSRIHSRNIALILPSECEGFGLPAVEAAACGSPVIATTESPLPQLLEGAGMFVAPRDEAALLSAMRRLATDQNLQASCGRIAQQRAAALTWSEGAAAALDAIKRAAA